ncbi:MAG: NAD-dependent epimerase/dehydratase family protein [Deltaproteobacteria bacterium]|nr:NAD-dependent epimerase/dehydratase family protein [Deltaproteobacteria bacterium]
MILVTGISGFIGSNIARLLLEKGCGVRGLVRKNSPVINLKGLDAELVEGDIRDLPSLKKAFSGIEACFHTAALVRLDGASSDDYFSTNLQGTINVCAEAMRAKVKKIIYTSTCETLRLKPDKLRDTIVTENISNSYSDMLSHYGRSKFLAEEHVRASVASGLPAVIVNPTAVTGPNDIHLTPPGSLIVSYCKGRIPVYFETGFNVVDVRDVAAGHVKAMENGRAGNRYILGGTNIMLSKLFAVLKEATGAKPFSFRLPYALIAAAAKLGNKELLQKIRASREPFFLDSAKARKELLWSPGFDLKASLKDAFDWYRENKIC